MKVLVLGVSGMAGHMVACHLHEMGWEVVGAARSAPRLLDFPLKQISLESISDLESLVKPDAWDAVINCFGVLNQEASIHPAQATFINAFVPHWLVERCKGHHTRIVHLSTDCVFSGRSSSYTEDAFRDGDTFYDRSKALGEFQSDKDLIFRQSIIGPDLRPDGIGLLNWFLLRRQPVQGYKNALWNGITTLELAKGIRAALEQPLTGIYHLVAPVTISKHDLLGLFAQAFGHTVAITASFLPAKIDKSLISTRKDFNFQPAAYPAQLEELASWMRSHKFLYPHYPML